MNAGSHKTVNLLETWRCLFAVMIFCNSIALVLRRDSVDDNIMVQCEEAGCSW